jgi:hypothetical protein
MFQSLNKSWRCGQTVLDFNTTIPVLSEWSFQAAHRTQQAASTAVFRAAVPSEKSSPILY